MATVRKLDIQISGDSKDAERAFDKLGKAAQDAEKDLSKVGDSNPFDKLKDSADEAGGGLMDKFASLGDGAMSALSGGITAGVGILAVGASAAAGVFMDAFGKALEQEADTKKLAAQMGLKGPLAEEAGKLAGDLYVAGFGNSLADTGEVIRAVSDNLANFAATDSDEFKDLVTQVATFTDVMGEDLMGTVSAVSQMIKTGLSPNAENALDVLTRGIQFGADKAGDLLDTFNEYPTQFRKLGLSGEQAMGLISQGLQAGARDSDIVADSLKELSIRAVDGSTLTADSFKALGLNADQMTAAFAAGGGAANMALDIVLDKLREVEDPATRAQIAVGLFGTQAEDMGAALAALDPSNAVTTLGSVQGATDDLSAAYDTNSAKIETLKREGMQSLVNFIGSSVIPKLGELKMWFFLNQDAIKTWGDRFESVIGAVGTMAQQWFGVMSSALQFQQRVWDVFGRSIGAVVTVFDKIWAAIKRVSDAVNNFHLPSFTPGGGIFGSLAASVVSKLPHFADGGMVPGALGSPQLAVVHGGEMVVPTGGFMGRGTVVENHFHIAGSVLTERSLIDAINDAQRQGYRLQSSGRGQ